MKSRLSNVHRIRLVVGLLLALGLAQPAPVHTHAAGDIAIHVELTNGCAGHTGAQHLHESHAVPAPLCPACAVGLASAFTPETGPVLAGLEGTDWAVVAPADAHGVCPDLRVAARGPPSFSFS
ncbi:MAG: hypothetical protein HY825_10655 [Acidobacteria bacterium]|nr:hypothetical protein [Acidobacteriota bacterium]